MDNASKYTRADSEESIVPELYKANPKSLMLYLKNQTKPNPEFVKHLPDESPV